MYSRLRPFFSTTPHNHASGNMLCLALTLARITVLYCKKKCLIVVRCIECLTACLILYWLYWLNNTAVFRGYRRTRGSPHERTLFPAVPALEGSLRAFPGVRGVTLDQPDGQLPILTDHRTTLRRTHVILASHYFGTKYYSDTIAFVNIIVRKYGRS